MSLEPSTGYPHPCPEQLVRGDVFRGKFRNSFEKPEPFDPGKVSKVELTMPDIMHTSRRGHRVMVQVQSYWFPLVDRNRQTFVNISTASEPDFHKATQRIYSSSNAASSLAVPVLSLGAPSRICAKLAQPVCQNGTVWRNGRHTAPVRRCPIEYLAFPRRISSDHLAISYPVPIQYLVVSYTTPNEYLSDT